MANNLSIIFCNDEDYDADDDYDEDYEDDNDDDDDDGILQQNCANLQPPVMSSSLHSTFLLSVSFYQPRLSR